MCGPQGCARGGGAVKGRGRFALAQLKQREPGQRLRPRRRTAIHMRRTVTPCSMAKLRLGGGDQTLKGANLIGKASLNVFEPGGCRRDYRC